MSNDRHLEENKGSMGTLFRRMTMASLGLDAMEDVSAQSFEVIDRADSFAQRLMGGVTRMMPSDSFERIGVATSSDTLWKELYSGIITTDGPKNATDVGEWQYWLDAVLLMLFDEDEEEAVAQKTAQGTKAASAAKAAQVAKAQQEALKRKQQIRERVAQLNASGVKPSMLRQLSTAKQRELAKKAGLFDSPVSAQDALVNAEKFAEGKAGQFAATLKEGAAGEFAKLHSDRADSASVAGKSVSSNQTLADRAEIGASSRAYSSMIRDFSESLIHASKEASVSASAGRLSERLTMSSEQVLASHVVERANRLAEAAVASGTATPETAGMVRAWTENVGRFSRSTHLDGSDILVLHEMQRLVADMSSKGLVGEDAVRMFKESSRAFAARSLENVLSKDFAGSLLLNRIENGIQAISDRQEQAQNISVSARAVRNAGSASNLSVSASQAEAVERRLTASIEDFSKVVRSYVDNTEDNASSVRWSRAVERFEQMQGMSEEQDRVLLRDVVESAGQLETSGVLPKGTVEKFIQRAADQVVAASNAESVRAARVDLLQKLSSGSVQPTAQDIRHAQQVERMGRRFNSLIENVSGSVSSLVASLKEAGFSSDVIEPLVRDMAQVRHGNISLEEGVSNVEMISRSLDSFVSRALGSLPAVKLSSRANVSGKQAVAQNGSASKPAAVSGKSESAVSGASEFMTVSGKSESAVAGKSESAVGSASGFSTVLAGAGVSGAEKAGAGVSRDAHDITSVSDISSIDQKFVSESAVERRAAQIGSSIDSFVGRMDSTVAEAGYGDGFDLIDGVRNFVASEDGMVADGAQSASAKSVVANAQAQRAAHIEEVRRYVDRIQSLQRETEEKFAATLAAISNETAVSENARAEIAKAIESRNVEQMIRVRNEVAAHISSSLNAQIEQAGRQMEEARKSFETVSQQVRQLEHAADLASMLHVASNQAYASKLVSPSATSAISALSEMISQKGRGVSLGNMSFDKAYLPILNETISAYARLRDEYSKFDVPSLSNLRIEETTKQLNRMLSLVQPAEMSGISAASSAMKPAFAQVIRASESVSPAFAAGTDTADSVLASNATVRKLLSAGSDTAAIKRVLESAGASSSEIASFLANTAASKAESASATVGAFEATFNAGRIGNAGDSVMASAANALGLDRAFGYGEIVPESMDKLQAQKGTIGHADNYTAMLGARKALELHTSDLVQGRTAEAGAFQEALSSVISSRLSSEPLEVYTVNEQGERIKVKVDSANAAQAMALRQPIGESYQPADARNASSVTASIDVEKIAQLQSVSGAEHFVPVMLGALSASYTANGSQIPGALNAGTVDGVNTSEAYASDGAAHEFVAASGANIGSVAGVNAAFGSSVSGNAAFGSVAGANVGSSLLDGRFSGSAFNSVVSDSYDGEKRLLNVSLGGTSVAMTPEAYMQAVAQPQISSSARSLAQNSDVLYNSIASVLTQQGASRSLNTLRRVFFEKLSEAGKTTARGWVGLNSQSFASLLGIDPASVQNLSSAAYEAEKGEFVKATAAESAESFGSNVEAGFTASQNAGSQNDGYAAMAAGDAHNYVSAVEGAQASAGVQASRSAASASYGMNFLRSAQESAARKASHQNSGELLGHIDSLLDYVEDVSNRNVGVFSTNDVVKVLVEQLPRESYLGERGLPKWRQKDARARQAEEARALREALSKIGATPIQGTQRFNDKKYVSPNLVPQDNSVAPLFSGGVESGSSPAGAANSSGYNSNQLESTGIPQADLEVLAKEILDMIYESLNEEYQRRRSE